MKIIPLHSLVIVIGTMTDSLKEQFPRYEIVDYTTICEELVGGRDDITGVVQHEVRRRAALKLTLGERVVIVAPCLLRDDRVTFAQIGVAAGVPVFYLLGEVDGEMFQATESDIRRGDGIAEVIDGAFSVIQKLPDDLAPLLRRRFRGITAVGDVHGMYESLQNAVSWARTRNHFLLFLGDVVDYGRQTLEVADAVYRIVMRGEGELILGNHERKICRYLDDADRRHRLSDGNLVTIKALDSLSPQQRRQWTTRFRALVAAARHHRRVENVLFAHAGAHPEFWDLTLRRLPRDLETRAIFGEVEWRDRQLHRLYDWCEHVPTDCTVIVGHDIRSTVMPLTVESGDGGQTIFLDTGCGKGGILSTADLKFCDDGKMSLVNLNQH